MANWKELFRKREIEIIFKNIPEGIFERAMELGAGSGLQTKLLMKYCKTLIVTEHENRFNLDELRVESDSISFQQCDAEKVDQVFDNEKFDLVFSSNMMEHLPDSDSSFRGIYNVLNDDGVSICTMPSPFMKILYMLLFYPAKIYSKLKIASKNRSVKGADTNSKTVTIKKEHDNNPKYNLKKNRFSRYFPSPHGACNDNYSEFFYWKKKRWINQIENAGFSVIKVIKLPVTTGYAFKLEVVCNFLYKIGFCSSYAYIAVKNKQSAFVKHFVS